MKPASPSLPGVIPATEVPGAAASERPWGQVLGLALGGGLLVGLGASELLVLSQLYWSTPRGALVVLALLLPPALALSLVAGLVVSLAARRPHLPEWLWPYRGGLLLGLLGGACCGLFFEGVAWGVSAWLVDPPLRGYSLGAVVAAAVVVAVALGLAWRERAALLGWLEPRGWRGAACAGLLAVGGLLCVLDARVHPQAYKPFHLLVEGAALLIFVVALWVPLFRLRSWRGLLVMLWVESLLLAWWGAVLPASDPLAEVLLYPTVHRRAVILARSFLDRDRDGFSAALGGGDCDDRDPASYPLAAGGRDCLGWVPAPAERAAAGDEARGEGLPPLVASDKRPDLLLLVTIDAFRCGFGRRDRAELRDICPNLTRLTHRHPSTLDLHAFYPATAPNLEASLRVRPRGAMEGGMWLLPALKHVGYRTELVATHPRIFRHQEIKNNLDEIDAGLIDQALQVTGVTSDETTTRVLERVREQRPGDPPRFLWAHYYDPHASYIADPASRIRGSDLADYAAEVRRTDEAIGRLVDTLDAPGEWRDIEVVITADHGEEFGEHGGTYHGRNVYGTTTRVPFLVLDLGRHQKPLPEELPFSAHGVGRYLLSIVTGQPFRAWNEAFMAAESPDDRQLGYVQGDWKLVFHHTLGQTELYNLADDPDETINRALEFPGLVRELGRRAAPRYLRLTWPIDN